jgi:hypothetical protein
MRHYFDVEVHKVTTIWHLLAPSTYAQFARNSWLSNSFVTPLFTLFDKGLNEQIISSASCVNSSLAKAIGLISSQAVFSQYAGA